MGGIMRRLLWIAAATLLVACAKDVVGPRSGVTLLVTNATCTAGACDSVRILAFPSNQPNTPGGPWSVDLGVMTTPQKCFALPPSAKFYVIAPESGQRGAGHQHVGLDDALTRLHRYSGTGRERPVRRSEHDLIHSGERGGMGDNAAY